MADALPRFSAELLTAVPHGFFGRFAEDDGTQDGMARYRQAVRDAVLPGARLAMLRQVHSAICVPVAEPWRYAERPEGDALVTDRPGTILGIVTADCAPVLLADPQAGVIGAAHAGWRGALAGVLEETVAAMERLGAAKQRISAAIGPAIAQASYEVDETFRKGFPAEAQGFFKAGREAHWHFDLPGYAADRLMRCGVGAVEALALDTYSHPARLHSYRRATHLRKERGGRQISAIALPLER